MSIEKIRKDIDKIDTEIVELLNKRVESALKIGQIKKKADVSSYVPSREKEIIEKLVKKNKGKLPKKALSKIYKEIISAIRNLEKPLAVAFLGPETTFTHMAAIKQFGSSVDFVEKKSIGEVFLDVEKGKCDFGVVPIENSTEGTVSHTLDMFIYSDINIVAEIKLDVKHNLVSKYPLDEIKKIYSHPQAFAQCRKWLIENLPKAELIEATSTANAAESASLYHSSAAIASKLASEKYGLEILSKGIQDEVNNKTRFLVVGHAMKKKTGNDKTSIVFSVKHEPGALHKILDILEKHNLNMTKIESRPIKKKLWEYVFYLDFEGYIEDENVKKALEELEQVCSFLKILGCYPQEM